MDTRTDRNLDLSAQSMALAQSYAAPNYLPIPVVLERGEGCWLWDADGRRYLDFVSAYSAVSHGHAHPRLVRALIDQAQKMAVTSRAYHWTTLGPFAAALVEAADLAGNVLRPREKPAGVAAPRGRTTSGGALDSPGHAGKSGDPGP